MVPQFHPMNHVRFNVRLDPVYRVAEKEWKDFIEKFTERLSEEVDDEIPILPPKDVIHRLYRDVGYRPISDFCGGYKVSRFDSATTRHLTRQISLLPSHEAVEKGFLLTVRCLIAPIVSLTVCWCTDHM
jgi:hypothetical protein